MGIPYKLPSFNAICVLSGNEGCSGVLLMHQHSPHHPTAVVLALSGLAPGNYRLHIHNIDDDSFGVNEGLGSLQPVTVTPAGAADVLHHESSVAIGGPRSIVG